MAAAGLPPKLQSFGFDGPKAIDTAATDVTGAAASSGGGGSHHLTRPHTDSERPSLSASASASATTPNASANANDKLTPSSLHRSSTVASAPVTPNSVSGANASPSNVHISGGAAGGHIPHGGHAIAPKAHDLLFGSSHQSKVASTLGISPAQLDAVQSQMREQSVSRTHAAAAASGGTAVRSHTTLGIRRDSSEIAPEISVLSPTAAAAASLTSPVSKTRSSAARRQSSVKAGKMLGLSEAEIAKLEAMQATSGGTGSEANSAVTSPVNATHTALALATQLARSSTLNVGPFRTPQNSIIVAGTTAAAGTGPLTNANADPSAIGGSMHVPKALAIAASASKSTSARGGTTAGGAADDIRVLREAGGSIVSPTTRGTPFAAAPESAGSIAGLRKIKTYTSAGPAGATAAGGTGSSGENSGRETGSGGASPSLAPRLSISQNQNSVSSAPKNSLLNRLGLNESEAELLAKSPKAFAMLVSGGGSAAGDVKRQQSISKNASQPPKYYPTSTNRRPGGGDGPPSPTSVSRVGGAHNRAVSSEFHFSKDKSPPSPALSATVVSGVVTPTAAATAALASALGNTMNIARSASASVPTTAPPPIVTRQPTHAYTVSVSDLGPTVIAPPSPSIIPIVSGGTGVSAGPDTPIHTFSTTSPDPALTAPDLNAKPATAAIRRAESDGSGTNSVATITPASATLSRTVPLLTAASDSAVTTSSASTSAVGPPSTAPALSIRNGGGLPPAAASGVSSLNSTTSSIASSTVPPSAGTAGSAADSGRLEAHDVDDKENAHPPTANATAALNSSDAKGKPPLAPLPAAGTTPPLISLGSSGASPADIKSDSSHATSTVAAAATIAMAATTAANAARPSLSVKPKRTSLGKDEGTFGGGVGRKEEKASASSGTHLPPKLHDLAYEGHHSGKSKVLDTLGITATELGVFGQAPAASSKAYQQLGVGAGPVIPDPARIKEQAEEVERERARLLEEQRIAHELAEAEAVKKAATPIRIDPGHIPPKAQTILFGGEKHLKSKPLDVLGVTAQELEFSQSHPKVFAQLGIGQRRRSLGRNQDDAVKAAQAAALAPDTITTPFDGKTNDEHANGTHTAAAGTGPGGTAAAASSPRAADSDEHKTAGGHHPIPRKAQDLLFGGTKKHDKLLDRLGITEQEMKLFGNQSKAFQRLGVDYNPSHAGGSDSSLIGMAASASDPALRTTEVFRRPTPKKAGLAKVGVSTVDQSKRQRVSVTVSLAANSRKRLSVLTQTNTNQLLATTKSGAGGANAATALLASAAAVAASSGAAGSIDTKYPINSPANGSSSPAVGAANGSAASVTSPKAGAGAGAGKLNPVVVNKKASMFGAFGAGKAAAKVKRTGSGKRDSISTAPRGTPTRSNGAATPGGGARRSSNGSVSGVATPTNRNGASTPSPAPTASLAASASVPAFSLNSGGNALRPADPTANGAPRRPSISGAPPLNPLKHPSASKWTSGNITAPTTVAPAIASASPKPNSALKPTRAAPAPLSRSQQNASRRGLLPSVRN